MNMETVYTYQLKTKIENGKQIWAWIDHVGCFLSPIFSTKKEAKEYQRENPMIRDTDAFYRLEL